MNIAQRKSIQNPVAVVLGLYLLCFMFRYIEYFYIRTDMTVIGEAVLHKLVGIIIMVIGARFILQSGSQLGFADKSSLKKALLGLGFGIIVYILAYFIEIAILLAQGNFNSISLYVTTYAVDKNIGNQTGILFFAICIIGNIINVVMEEGVFRGLFQKTLEKKHSFIVAALLCSILFGLWHIIAPIRSYYDGNMGTGGMVASIVMLVITSGLVGFKFALITKLTGSLYMAMGDHFVNNTIVNMLHVISNSGSDELMLVRITIAQTVSFIAVLVYYYRFLPRRAC